MATQEQDIEELISEQALEAGTSLWKDAWYRLIRNKAALISGIYVVILLILAILTPWIAPYEFDAVNYDKIGAPPTF